jgi:hypothetical protein
MRDHRSAVRLLLPLGAAALLLAGCGSSSGTNAGTTSAPAGGGSTSSAVSTPSDTTGSTQVAGGDAFCQKIVAEKTALTTNALPALLQNGTPAGWQKYLEATASMNNELYDAAPDEIKSAVDQLRQANVKITAIMSAAGYDIRKVKATGLIAAFSSADYKKATTDFSTYVKTHCSIDLTKP